MKTTRPRSRSTAHKWRNSRRPILGASPAELLIAPLASLLLILCIFLVPRDPHDLFKCCGALSGHYNIPRLKGPDPLQRAAVLEIRPEGATLDGSEIDQSPQEHYQNPDWKISRLVEQLEANFFNWRMNHPGETRQVDLLLHVHRDINAQYLRSYLYSLQLAEGSRIQLVTSSEDGVNSAAQVVLVPLKHSVPEETRGPHTLRLTDFRTYEALLREVVARRQMGRPVFLSLV